jgi:hypothetical protein
LSRIRSTNRMNANRYAMHKWRITGKSKVCPPSLPKTGRIFSPSARKSRLVFLPLQMRISTKCQYTFSRQSESRHNTLDFAAAKSCAKGGCGPLWKPPGDCPSSLTSQPKPLALAGYRARFGQYESRRMSSLLLRHSAAFVENGDKTQDEK